MPLAESHGTQRTPPQLLVSVRDRAEAEIALSSGVAWIDLKDPSAGPLGAPRPQVAQEVAQRLRFHACRSVALGELQSLEDGLVTQFSTGFPLLKLGLSDQAHNPGWQSRLRQIAEIAAVQGSCVVPVIYGDWQNCGAPTPRSIVDFARESSSTFVLIDTYTKNGMSLLDWLSYDELAGLISDLWDFGCQTVLAGSLSESTLGALSDLPVAAFGVRGAICVGARDSSVCPKKLAAWVARFATP